MTKQASSPLVIDFNGPQSRAYEALKPRRTLCLPWGRGVGKSWFITTPNYWFPLEVHYLLPFFQFLPGGVQRIYSRISPNAALKGNLIDLALLSARDLRRFFPASEIAKMRVTFWPETLVAYHVDPARKLDP